MDLRTGAINETWDVSSSDESSLSLRFLYERLIIWNVLPLFVLFLYCLVFVYLFVGLFGVLFFVLVLFCFVLFFYPDLLFITIFLQTCPFSHSKDKPVPPQYKTRKKITRIFPEKNIFIALHHGSDFILINKITNLLHKYYWINLCILFC